MANELSPKILEYRIVEADTPELILDYYTFDSTINFAGVAGAIEQVIGVQYTTIDAVGNTMRVILRNDTKTYDQVRKLIQRSTGYMPFASWNQ